MSKSIEHVHWPDAPDMWMPYAPAIKVRGGTQLAGAHEGGWTGQVMPGLNAGGWVPGSDPGYDNILWPLNSGGRTLQQPLAGDEFVVNSKDSAFWAPMLEWMNSGGRPPRPGGRPSPPPPRAARSRPP